MKNELRLNFEYFQHPVDCCDGTFNTKKLNDVIFFEYKPGYFISKDVLFRANRNNGNIGYDQLILFMNKYKKEDLKNSLIEKNVIDNNFEGKIKWFIPSVKDVFTYPDLFEFEKNMIHTQYTMGYWLNDKYKKIDEISSTYIEGVVLGFTIKSYKNENYKKPFVGHIVETEKLIGDNWKW
jgi:hypothetical protein